MWVGDVGNSWLTPKERHEKHVKWKLHMQHVWRQITVHWVGDESYSFHTGFNPTNLGFCPRDWVSQEVVLLYQELGLASNGLLKTTKSPFVSFSNPSESGRPV